MTHPTDSRATRRDVPRAAYATRGICLVALLAIVALLPVRAHAFAGAVAAPDRYGAEAAEEILKAGGNAVDAAVATALALAVTYPEAGNLGGGGFATVLFGGKAYFLDYREVAPKAARADMYLDAHGDVVAGASTIGARAAGVPGTVMGLWELHHRFGKLPWRRLFAPALRYAQQGFVVSRQLESRRAEYAAAFAGRTNFAAYFGTAVHDVPLRQPELAATLLRIQREGPADFYRGRTAHLIAAEMQRDHGLISAADLAGYRAIWRTPLETDWAGYHVITAPPPSSGGIALVALLKMKAAVAPLFRDVPLNSPQY
ncbi:MAG: gamma-glutamyltransferase, partial [Proteobacteria bacterium]|nr:gamma-glutamyltransferase [Pseudomonadota bacterium]